MSIQTIFDNIRENFSDSERLLEALERITEKPEIFEKFLDAEAFFSCSHDLECPLDGCLECFEAGGDTVFGQTEELVDLASKLFKKAEIIKVKKVKKQLKPQIMVFVPPLPKILK